MSDSRWNHGTVGTAGGTEESLGGQIAPGPSARLPFPFQPGILFRHAYPHSDGIRLGGQAWAGWRREGGQANIAGNDAVCQETR